MPNDTGTWVMHGMDWDDPFRIRTWKELINYIDQVGFLPLFANEIPGFSVEDHVSPLFWWTGDPEQDPWEWRQIIARTGKVVYGKFFDKKAGFVSRKWFPYFANYRRDGYDFDARWEDELANNRSKKIVDLFETVDELYSFEIKKLAGFGKGGEKNFEGTIAALQMQTYVITKDFRCRKRKKDGVEYGWPISVYTTPEILFGSEFVSAAYKEDPVKSFERMKNRIREEYPWASEKAIERILK